MFCFDKQGFSEVEDLLKKEGICLAVTDKLPKDSGVAAASTYDVIIKRLRAHIHARGTYNNTALP